MDDPTIRHVENALRDLIAEVLQLKLGAAWEEHLCCDPGRVNQWRKRRDVEKQRRAGAHEGRLLYYADFADLQTLVDGHWDDGLGDVLVDREQTRVYLRKLNTLRRPVAHSRDLNQNEQNLVEGMAGDILQRVTLYHARLAAPEPKEIFAHIDSISDNLGHTANATVDFSGETPLRVGDQIHFRGFAWDPNPDAELEWMLDTRPEPTYKTGHAVEFLVNLTNRDVGDYRSFMFRLFNRTTPYSRQGGERGQDDQRLIRYKVLPPE